MYSVCSCGGKSTKKVFNIFCCSIKLMSVRMYIALLFWSIGHCFFFVVHDFKIEFNEIIIALQHTFSNIININYR